MKDSTAGSPKLDNGPAAERLVIAGRKARGKSELRRAVRRLTAGRGNPKDSGTENIPPAPVPSRDCGAVRVKRCGKSAPHWWQHRWQAKPRTEQGQIGERVHTARVMLPGRLLDPLSNERARGMITLDRIRLMRSAALQSCLVR